MDAILAECDNSINNRAAIDSSSFEIYIEIIPNLFKNITGQFGRKCKFIHADIYSQDLVFRLKGRTKWPDSWTLGILLNRTKTIVRNSFALFKAKLLLQNSASVIDQPDNLHLLPCSEIYVPRRRFIINISLSASLPAVLYENNYIHSVVLACAYETTWSRKNSSVFKIGANATRYAINRDFMVVVCFARAALFCCLATFCIDKECTRLEKHTYPIF